MQRIFSVLAVETVLIFGGLTCLQVSLFAPLTVMKNLQIGRRLRLVLMKTARAGYMYLLSQVSSPSFPVSSPFGCVDLFSQLPVKE
jgi:hypothetical protein